jgi:hypothetical protein
MNQTLSVKDLLIRAALGTVTPAGGIAVSTLQYAEMWLKLASLAVGLVVGILSAISIIKNLRKK